MAAAATSMLRLLDGYDSAITFVALVSRHRTASPHAPFADPKDSRSLKDRAAAEKKMDKEEDEAAKHQPRPTEIAESHGNKPSKGAIVDEQIQLEEEAELRKKGKI